MIAGRRAMAVVARREVRERLRDRTIVISTIFSVLILAGIVLLPRALGAGEDPKATVLAADGASLRVARLAAQGDEAFGVRVQVERVRDDRAAVARVRDDDGDVAVLDGARRLVAGRSAEDAAIAAVQAASQQARARAAPPAPLPVAQTGEDDDAAQALASIALIVLYGQLLTYGIWIATGIVEEKSSRVVELLLAAVRPRDLLAGKIIGLGIVGLVQLLVVGGSGLAMAAATGDLDVGGPGVPAALGIALAWFLLGYGLYATAYAMAGSLVPRQEDVQSATTPLTILIIAVFFLGFTAVQDPGGDLARVLSLLPPSAPLVMPVRMIAGEASAGEVLLAVALALAAIVLLVRTAARVYANAVLRTGGRVKLTAAFRGDASP